MNFNKRGISKKHANSFTSNEVFLNIDKYSDHISMNAFECFPLEIKEHMC